jgi:hypothetical protein
VEGLLAAALDEADAATTGAATDLADASTLAEGFWPGTEAADSGSLSQPASKWITMMMVAATTRRTTQTRPGLSFAGLIMLVLVRDRSLQLTSFAGVQACGELGDVQLHPVTAFPCARRLATAPIAVLAPVILVFLQLRE